MLVSDFHFDLPDDLIAQQPPTIRGASRMLQLDRRTGAYADRQFTDLPDILQPGDLLVLNDSRVLPARLFATRAGLTTQQNSPTPSGQIEVLLTERLDTEHNDWAALVRPAKKIQPGETLYFFDPALTLSSRPKAASFSDAAERSRHLPLSASSSNLSSRPERSAVERSPHLQPLLTATILTAGDFGERTLRFSPTPNFHATLERIGHLPLPPYIHRDKHQPNTPEDRERYQTVYSKSFARTATEPGAPCPDSRTWVSAQAPIPAGSAAAPTAGLHLTPEILNQLKARGVEIAYITLHVGLGTFQPVRVDRTEDIRLHAEPYSLSAATAESLNAAIKEGRRIIAVGTTTTRTLEHIARESERTGFPIEEHSGSTSLFLSPGLNDDFKLVQGLLTNFHLPHSTLLMLVSAFAGREAVLRAYAHAVAAHYRFFSYGDCMLIL